MPFDFLIIGSGLSGLFAGCLAARRGKKAVIVSRGIGSTHVGAGTIDVFNGSRKEIAARAKSAEHPYGKVGLRGIESALNEFKTICAEGGYPLRGEVGANWTLPTAVGSTRQTCLAPETMIGGDLNRHEPFALANLYLERGSARSVQPRLAFRDFSAALAAANLKACAVTLPLPHTCTLSEVEVPTLPHTSATDLARLFDRADYRDQLIAAWKPLLKDAPKRIGIPAVLGLEQPLIAKQHLDSELDIELFEIPILPPSVPGARLFNILHGDFQNHGGQLILGPVVNGRIENGRATVSADANGRVKEYAAETIILASGGFLNGGLAGEFDGAVRETVFNLDVDSRSGLLPHTPRQSWTSEIFLDAHAFSKFGLRADRDFRPLDANGEPAAANLRAIGGLLAGADRLSEGSRDGIGLATAYRAIEIL